MKILNKLKNYFFSDAEKSLPSYKKVNITVLKLRKQLEVALLPLGYLCLPSRINKLYFVKHIDSGFYLAFGSTFGRYDSSMFALDLYYSILPSNFFTNGNVHRITSRIEEFLNGEEVRRLITYPEIEHYDIGWLCKDDSSVVDKLVKIIELVENRFLNSIEIENIFNDELFKSLCEMYFKIINIVINQVLSCRELSYINLKSDIYKIGMEWYKATEIYFENKIKKMQRKMLIEIAISAYRIYHCERLYGRSKYVQNILYELGMYDV